MAPTILTYLTSLVYLSSYIASVDAAPSHPRPRTLVDDFSPNPENYLLGRQDDSGTDIGDQSWVKSYTALGDSYAAGIGAGTLLTGDKDYDCSRYDSSYPVLLNIDETMGDPSGRQFSFLACSGAIADKVINDQLPATQGNQDLITLSIGGNDLGLVDILNGCIFQWNPFKNCDDQLKKAQDIVNGGDLAGKFDQILSGARSKLSSNGMIYWTGYAHFWGTEDNQCDSVTWSFWFNLPSNKEYLTLERRKTMNSLVDQLNGKISEAIQRSGGDQVVFVDYAKYYDGLISRFCEAGWPETDPNRVGLAFYQWDTDDNADADNLEPRQDSGNTPMVMNGTVDAWINEYIQEGLEQNPDLQTDQIDLVFRPLPDDGSLPDLNSTIPENQRRTAIIKRQDVRLSPELAAQGFVLSSIPVPDSYGKIFHPRQYGYAMITNLILYEMTATNARRQSTDVPDVIFEPAPGTCKAQQLPAQTCNANSASSIPNKMLGADDKELSPNDVMFALRDVLCNNKCELPPGFPSDVGWSKGEQTAGQDCEIAVAIQGGIEAYLNRATAATDSQQQQCWGETEEIINSCVNNGPNEGWVNGPNDYQFYQGGFRGLNAQGSKHPEINPGSPPLKSATPPGGIVAPDTNDGITCGHDANVGTSLNQCVSMINTYIIPGLTLSDTNTTEGICTDSDFCHSKGESMDKDGKVDLGPYCEVLTRSGCSFVIATKKSTFGFPGRACVSPAAINQYLRTMNSCPGDDAWAAQIKQGESFTTIALVGDHGAASVFA